MNAGSFLLGAGFATLGTGIAIVISSVIIGKTVKGRDGETLRNAGLLAGLGVGVVGSILVAGGFLM